jgi:hypothetical protein
MKQRYTLGLLVLAACSQVTAQTLTDPTTSFQPGESFLLHYSAYVSPGNAGANVTWDLSSLTDDSTEVVSFVAPQGTPAYASFPASTAAQPSEGGDLTYFSCNGSGIELLGSTAGADLVVYQDGERIMSYPCAFNTQWQDAFNASFTVLGLIIDRAGTITGNADGYGSVVLPYGTVNNVLRVRTTEVYTDVTPFGDIGYDFDSYYFYKPGVHVPVAAVRDYAIDAFGNAQVVQSAEWLDESFLSMADAFRYAIGIDLFPNPARTSVSVVFGADGAKGLRMELVDAAGRVVLRQDLGRAMAGIQRQDLDVSALAPGLYNVHISDGLGGQGVKRLVIE